MPVNVGINGFGRIGRNVLRAALNSSSIQITAVNDLGSAKNLGHLLKYDSLYGQFPGKVEYKKEDSLYINDREIKFYHEGEPQNIPWGDQGIDVVIDATGIFKSKAELEQHLAGGAKKVVLTAPGKDVDTTIVMGVNHKDYDPETHNIISNASCTTNGLAPVAKVLEDEFGIEEGIMTTIHAYTNDQKLLDLPHDDLRRARAANISMIPTTSGAAKAVSLVLPQLEGKIDGIAIRVPVPVVSLIDFVIQLKENASAEEVNAALQESSRGELEGILGVSREPLVSIDYKGDSHSTVVDLPSTMVTDNGMLKILSWYDNEWGYSVRVLDLAELIAEKILSPAGV